MANQVLFSLCLAFLFFFLVRTAQINSSPDYPELPYMSVNPGRFLSGVRDCGSPDYYHQRLTVTNNCLSTIWPATLTSSSNQQQLSSTGFELAPGQSQSFHLLGPWTGRVWARTRCTTTSGRFTCLTGDCGSGQVSCFGAGSEPPATLAEFTFSGDRNGGKDFYDVSNVDGFNIPVSISPLGGTGSCVSSNCSANVNRVCPAELQVRSGDEVIGCKSACATFNEPQYCCTGEYNDATKCVATNYSQIFKTQCPLAYSYAYDDENSTFTCNSSPNYLVTFCP